MISHRHILQSLGGHVLVAKALELRVDVVRKWASRNRIPAEHWLRLSTLYPGIRLDVLQAALPKRARPRRQRKAA